MKTSSFVRKLQSARRGRGETVAQTAKRAGIYSTQLHRLEQGKTQPWQVAVGVAIALVRALQPGLSLKDFTK